MCSLCGNQHLSQFSLSGLCSESLVAFEQVILLHSVRENDELAYRDLVVEHLPQDESRGVMIAKHAIRQETLDMVVVDLCKVNRTICTFVRDVFSLIGEEFLLTDGGERIRLDKIKSIGL